ncbi:MAG: hypothetical protein K6F35_12735 [Lachnospiraceae bacterium]|nr:hypothetical protein [Lachnospiraceae bacterium]
MDGYEKLANSIIIRAAKDYRAALKKIRRNPGNRDAAETAVQCEEFFDSRWFSALTTVDGEWLKEKLRKEAAGA